MLSRWLIVVFFVAVVPRIAHVIALQDSPYFSRPIIDAKTYHDAAVAIAAGDGHPDRIFWQPPGYAYFLGVLYKLTGQSFLIVKIIQALIGAMSAVLTGWIGARLFLPSVGIASGFIVALYGTLIYFDGELLTPTLTIALQLAAVAFFVRAKRGGRNKSDRRWWAASGMAGGLASVVTAPSLVLVAVMAWFAKRQALPLLLGAAVAIGPVTLRNVARGGEFVPISHNGGINFYIGNNPNYDATVGIRPDREWKKLTAEPSRRGIAGVVASSNYFFNRSLAYLGSDPVGYTVLQFRKAYLMACGNEFYRNQAIYPTRHDSPVLAVLLWKIPGLAFPFGILLPLALVGLIGSGRRSRFLMVVVILYALAGVAFFVTARYRLPLVPFLAIFAAEGVRWFVADGRGQRRAIAIAVAVAAFGVANIAQGEMRSRMNADAEYSLAVQLADEGRSEEAAALYESALEQKPDYAEAWLNVGVIYLRDGRRADAETAFVNAFRYDPEDADALVNLGNLRLEAGKIGEAESLYQKALELKPGHEMARDNLQVLRRTQPGNTPPSAPSDGDMAGWRDRYETDPTDMTALGNLIAGHELRGETENAVALLLEATAARPTDAQLCFSLGRLQVKAGQVNEGVVTLRRALELGGPTVRGWIEKNTDVAPVRDELLTTDTDGENE